LLAEASDEGRPVETPHLPPSLALRPPVETAPVPERLPSDFDPSVIPMLMRPRPKFSPAPGEEASNDARVRSRIEAAGALMKAATFTRGPAWRGPWSSWKTASQKT